MGPAEGRSRDAAAAERAEHLGGQRARRGAPGPHRRDRLADRGREHETRHRIVFLRRLDWLSDADQRLCTCGVKVSPITRFFYGGLDEHVEHHLFPGVPSRNLTALREAMKIPVPERKNVVACWKEIYAIAKHREAHPEAVFVPAGVT